MGNFKDNLKELMLFENITINDLTEKLNISKRNMLVYNWLNCYSVPRLNYAIQLGDIFYCSLDYLFGRTLNFEKQKFKSTPPFDEQLKKIIKEFKVSQYKLVKDRVCNMGNFHKWFKLKSTPKIESLIKLADYFNISLDYLVGRE